MKKQKQLLLCVLIVGNRFRELIGARGCALAFDAAKQGFDFVKRFTLDKPRDALQVAATTADKTNVVQTVFRVNVE